MGRPRTALGTWGAIASVGQVQAEARRWVTAPKGTKPTRWRARTKVRDLDGKVRDVERFAPTRAKAEAALKAALTDRVTPRQSNTLRADMGFAEAGAVWLGQIRRPESGLSRNTVAQYEAAWRRHVEGSTLAHLTLREANRVPAVRSFLERVADERGSGSAKTARTVVSLVLGMAVHEGLFDVNAARQVRTPRRAATPTDRPLTKREAALLAKGVAADALVRDTDRALTEDERAQIVATARADEGANGNFRRSDVADLVAFLAAVGPRIEEALSLRWEDVNLGGGKVRLRGTKTDTSDRTLSVTPWAVDVLRHRHELEGKPSSGYVFHAPMGGLEDKRDRRNATRALRALLDRAGFPWATAHTFRRTVATLLDARGLPLAQVADYLGHADPAMTARVYLGRKVDTSRAAALL